MFSKPSQGKHKRDLIKLLIVEDEEDTAQLMAARLRAEHEPSFEVQIVKSVSETMIVLPVFKPDAILLDLNLDDSKGIKTFSSVHSVAFDVPIVINSCMTDQLLAVRAIRDGAQDFVVKGKMDLKFLARTILFALERSEIQKEIGKAALLDNLTGLYNRTGFSTLAQQQLKIAKRDSTTFGIFAADIDDLQKINGEHGEEQGDLAIISAAKLLRQTLRDSDVIARVDGDEFMAFVVNPKPECEEAIMERLSKNFGLFNATQCLAYTLSISCGYVQSSGDKVFSLDYAMELAGRELHRNKRRHKAA